MNYSLRSGPATRDVRKLRGVFERPPGSGIWHISYCDAEGRRHREKVGPRTAAIEAYRLRKTEIRLGKFFPPRRESKLSFGALVDEALAYRRTRVAPRTWSADRVRAALLKKWWGALPSESVTAQRIEERLRELREQQRSGSTVNRYRSLLSSLFTFALRTGRVSGGNPVAGVPRYREGDHRIRFLSPEEEAALRRTIRRRCPEREPEFDLALHTGLRRGEQFTLQWENVDLDRGLLTVHGKTGRRFVELNSIARRALERLRKQSNGSAFVCPETRSQAQRDWRRWFEDAVRDPACGIENICWHDLRHTFASRLVMAGVDLATVRELLGHKSIVMTMRYAHLAPAHRLAAVERLAGPQVRPDAQKSPSGAGSGTGGGRPKAKKRQRL